MEINDEEFVRNVQFQMAVIQNSIESESIEKEMDSFELLKIANRRGKEWIERELENL